MKQGFFSTVFYQPLYNGLIFLLGSLPWIDAGLAIIIFTVIVRLILFPLSKQSVKTQIQMKTIEPELAKIKEEYKDNRTVQAQKTMELYKQNGIRPFAGFFLILIQLPFIFALYRVFYLGGLPNVQTDLLYSFVIAPSAINIFFLGLFDITKRSITLAVVAALCQFIQARFSTATAPQKPPVSGSPSLQHDIARSMSFQMRYIFPIFIFIIAYTVPAVVAIYLSTSSLFTLAQELYLRKKYKSVGIAK